MAVFKKPAVYWIDDYVQGHRKRERIGPDKRLAETEPSWRSHMGILRRRSPDELLREVSERKAP